MAKSIESINAEKATKSRLDLVPPDAGELAGMAFAKGAIKHGLGSEGLGTYRTPGIEQSTVWSHWASMERHAASIKRGEFMDDGPSGTGLPHLACMCAQVSIIASLLQRPPGAIHPWDRRWYAGREGVTFSETVEEWAAQASTPETSPQVPRSPLHPRVGDVYRDRFGRTYTIDGRYGSGGWSGRWDGSNRLVARGTHLVGEAAGDVLVTRGPEPEQEKST